MFGLQLCMSSFVCAASVSRSPSVFHKFMTVHVSLCPCLCSMCLSVFVFAFLSVSVKSLNVYTNLCFSQCFSMRVWIS